MKKINFILVLMSLVLQGCSFSFHNNLDTSVRKFVNQFSCIVLFKHVGTEFYFQKIYGEDLKSFKNNFDIKKIDEYTLDVNKPLEGDYHPIDAFIGSKKKTFLYSVNKKSIILRKKDLYPEKFSLETKIKAYEIEVPDSVIKVLIKYDSQLPKNGMYLETISPY